MSSTREQPETSGLSNQQTSADETRRDETAAAGRDWSGLVRRIQEGDQEGMEELYAIFSRGIRFFLCRQLGPQELDDKVHDTFLIVVHAIRRGELRDPDRLMGFVRTIVRRQIASYIDAAVQNRREQAEIDAGVAIVDREANPELSAIDQERESIMQRVLGELSRRDREILTRFYLYEQSQEQICRDMNLTDTQFRLLKSRAKARFGEIGRRRLQSSLLSNFSLRNNSGKTHSL
ncbi:MAG TPA: sigma-70 family RNA polymerase sigma factor [Bryobacteraceae bacterium]|nr:sigma-70 family RNA polymerase sigma factor [Bryobacteraceae bacterium]